MSVHGRLGDLRVQEVKRGQKLVNTTGNRLDSFALKMEAACFLETSMSTNDPTWFRNPECYHNISAFWPECCALCSDII